MTLEEALSEGKGILGNRLEVELLLSSVCGKDRWYFIGHSNERLEEELFGTFRKLILLRKQGIPLQYLTYQKEFFGLEFYVDERCFIPRPETELLVEKVIEFAGILSKTPVRILDVGTGSGAIAVSLAKSLSAAELTAVDISEEALEVAIMNAERHYVSDRIAFLQSDLLENVLDRDFEIIVANLPYIGEKKFSFVEQGVRGYEPKKALFGGDDGLELYRKLFAQLAAARSARKFPSSKFLIGEFGFLQAKALAQELNKYFVQSKISFLQDLAGLDRVFIVYIDKFASWAPHVLACGISP